MLLVLSLRGDAALPTARHTPPAWFTVTGAVTVAKRKDPLEALQRGPCPRPQQKEILPRPHSSRADASLSSEPGVPGGVHAAQVAGGSCRLHQLVHATLHRGAAVDARRAGRRRDLRTVTPASQSAQQQHDQWEPRAPRMTLSWRRCCTGPSSAGSRWPA